jgi:mannosyl-3-phosphoglycerate phosphatase
MQFMIFTDLDGSLLHPRTYSFEDAMPALELLREKGVPLVLCSSKTRAEIEVYRKRLDNRHPFIVENGGGIFIPEGYFPFPVDGEARGGYRVIHLGTAYREIRKQFARLRDELKIPAIGFGDMTPDEVVSLTGLTENEATLAMQREYDEPFVFSHAPDERLLSAIEATGLRWTQGRFFHIMGNHHKGKAVTMLRAFFERAQGPAITIGLGDGLNDLPFLLAVDRPVLIRKENGSYDPRVTIPGLYRTEGIGPRGWNEAIVTLLQ